MNKNAISQHSCTYWKFRAIRQEKENHASWKGEAK